MKFLRFAGFGIERGFVAVGDVENVIGKILSDDKPSAALVLALNPAELKTSALAQRVVHEPDMLADLFS